MKNRELEKTGEKLSAIRLACIGMSYAYGPVDNAESIATLEEAINIGINFWDTADTYGNGEPAQLALAWVLLQGDHMIPIPVTKKRKYLRENAGAAHVELTKEDLKKIDEVLTSHPDTGQRYGAGAMKLVNR
ncbi:MAG TPA: aldo/keto reductase [Flavitalea sp.]|nr:aldo/keto reductase [Flavitalea sp.]